MSDSSESKKSSSKRNRGSQTQPQPPPPPRNARSVGRNEGSQREWERERERQQERELDVPTECSSSSSHAAAQAPPMPLLLVASQPTRELKDAEANTDPAITRLKSALNRTSRAPRSIPVDDVNRLPLNAPGLAFPKTRKSSTSSDNYDWDEPLTNKTTKIYKKRQAKPNTAGTLSDDSIENQFKSYTRFTSTAVPDAGNDNNNMSSPHSDESDQRQHETSDSFGSLSSIYVTEAELMDLDPNKFQQGNLPDNIRLASGLAFIYMAIPPDGGYGWVVLVLSFVAQLIVDGIIFSIGILLPHMASEFGVNSGQVVLVASIQIGCYFMGGAFSSALINSYGFRPVALLGVGISALAILAASFSPNLWTMIVLYSIIGGPGLSMIWVSSQLIIGFYFERYRPIASGFSCSGAGAGIFIFSIANTSLVNSIGWRNTIRVHVLLICLLFFIGLAYFEVKPTPVGVVHRTGHLSSTSSNEYYGNFYVHYFLNEDASNTSTILETYEPKPKKKQGRLRRCANKCCPCCFRSAARDQASISNRSERNYLVRPDPMQKDDLFYTGPIDYEEPHHKEQFDGKEVELVGTQTHLQSAAYGLHNIHNYDSASDVSDMASASEAGLYALSPKRPSPASQQSHRKKFHKPKQRGWFHRKVMRGLGRLFDVHLLKNFEFRFLLASAFLYPMGFNIPFVYSKMRTTIPVQYAQMISPAIGISNFLGRILCGFIAYKLRSWTTYICGGGMVLGGSIVFISAFYGSDLVWFQLLYGLCYGIAPAVFATLRALIYVRYLGLSKLTNAFGITALAMGLGVFIGTTLGGIMVDKTGGYMAAFAFAGVCIMLAGVLKLILPAVVKRRNKHKKNSV